MHLRPITTTDNQQVKALIQTSLTSFGLNTPGTAYCDPQLGQLTEHYARIEKAAYWVFVNHEKEVLACGGYGPLMPDGSICELQKLYVSAIAQGQGLSTLLMTTILTEAKKDYQQIYLETSQKLVVANTLYRKYGFKELARPLVATEHDAMDSWYLKQL